MLSIVETPWGRLFVVVNKGALDYCNWQGGASSSKLQKIMRENLWEENAQDKLVMKKVLRQIDEYFSGKRKEFSLPLNLRGTDFQMKVWEEIVKIKYGDTLSYKELAQRCGDVKGARAVAQACGANPIALVVPCHRVVASDGTSGGYAGGTHIKLRLLQLENPTDRSDVEGQ